MKIALFTSNRTTVPPEKNVVAASAALTAVLADKLVESGHDVTLYAPLGSTSKAKIVDLGLKPFQLDYALRPEEWVRDMNLGTKLYYIGELFKDADKYDIIHLQTEPVYLGMPFTKMTKTPVIFTCHNIFISQAEPLLNQYKDLPIVSISDYQRKIIPQLNYVDTIYNGLDVSSFPFNEESSDYMYHIGRMVPVKGIREAIETARQTSFPLVLAGAGTDVFIKETITPYISDKIQFKGVVDRESLEWYQNYAQAKLLLLPLQWDEPFGLVMIESMATGTPVVAFARGASPEIIKDGVTGFIVNPSENDIRGDFIIKKTGLAGITEAVKRIYSMDEKEYREMRRASRKHVEENFTVEKMVSGYINIYKKMIEGSQK